MHKRVYTAIVFTAVLIAAVLLQGWAERVVLLACMLTGVWEMCGAMQAKGMKPNRPVACAYCCLTVVMQGLSASGVHPFDRMDAPLTAMVFGVMLGFSVVVFSGKPDFERALATCFPMLYPGLPFGLMITLMDRSCAFVSALAMALALFTASINDVFALFGGSAFGKHKLSPLISPKKTVEGAVSGLLASVAFAALLPACFMFAAKRFPALDPTGAAAALPPIWAFALLGLCAGALSQIGDLAASIVKRWCGLKDFGRVFPGHGGMMDRFDGILFCAFACYIFFEAMGL